MQWSIKSRGLKVMTGDPLKGTLKLPIRFGGFGANLKVQTDRSGISRHLQRHRWLRVVAGFSSADTESRASSVSLCGAVISSFRWSIAGVRQSHDVRIPQTRAVRRSAGLP